MWDREEGRKEGIKESVLKEEMVWYGPWKGLVFWRGFY